MSDSEGDYVTPLASLCASRRQLAFASRTSSVYLSASELPSGMPGSATMDDLHLMTHMTHPSDAGHLGESPSFTFRDGLRSVDYVLVWQEMEAQPGGDEDASPTQHTKWQHKRDLFMAHSTRRVVFEGNLRQEGLQMEEDFVPEVPLRFVKIHVPQEVCCRYAEILKIRMPMKEKLDDCFVKKRFVLHFPGLPALEISAPAMLVGVTDTLSSWFNFLRTNTQQFPPMDRHFTAVYSRDREYLFDMSGDFFSSANRARIMDFILRRKKFCSDEDADEFAFGIEKLLNDGTYEAAYPIHEGNFESGNNSRAVLFKHWASIRNFYKYQPLDHIREYFGVKIALYFAWLGFYTYMLIPASIVGFFCFLYAVSTIHLHKPSNDICNLELGESIQMCPLCDKFCDYWSLNDTCFHAKFTYLVDNPATVFFAVFMSFWGEWYTLRRCFFAVFVSFWG